MRRIEVCSVSVTDFLWRLIGIGTPGLHTISCLFLGLFF